MTADAASRADSDPRELVASSPLSRGQIVAIAMCVLLNALDGFDVLSISFAAPGIAAQWQIDRAALGVVLSMELIGMAAGSLLLGLLCDRRGRRPTILLCLVLMALGMAGASQAGSVAILSACRLFTGLGIGGMLAATNAATAEFTNKRRHDMAVALMAAGYPLGAIIGGSIASVLLAHHGWRAVFLFGAGASLAAIPLVWFLLPETIAFLVRRNPPQALSRVNRTLVKWGHAAAEALPGPEPEDNRFPLARLFATGLRRTTFCLVVAYVAQILTFYFILKWTPKIVVDMGFNPSSAGGVLVWANVGGLAGAVTLSLLTGLVRARWLTIGSMVVSVLFVALFGRSAADLRQLSLLACVAGFFTNAGMVGLYALLAGAFPTAARGSGTGLVIGLGRGGAALSPVLAGMLFQAGSSLPRVALIMGLGSIVAAGAVLMLPRARSA